MIKKKNNTIMSNFLFPAMYKPLADEDPGSPFIGLVTVFIF